MPVNFPFKILLIFKAKLIRSEIYLRTYSELFTTPINTEKEGESLDKRRKGLRRFTRVFLRNSINKSKSASSSLEFLPEKGAKREKKACTEVVGTSSFALSIV